MPVNFENASMAFGLEHLVFAGLEQLSSSIQHHIGGCSTRCS